MCILGIELRLLGLVATPFPFGAMSPALAFGLQVSTGMWQNFILLNRKRSFRSPPLFFPSLVKVRYEMLPWRISQASESQQHFFLNTDFLVASALKGPGPWGRGGSRREGAAFSVERMEELVWLPSNAGSVSGR